MTTPWMDMLERFNNTKRPCVRVAVLLACVLVAACSGTDRKKFDATYRSGKALSAATDRGVSAPRYRELVTSFEAQISVVRRRAGGPEERDLVDQYDDALKAYLAALAIWTLKLEGQSDWVYSGPELTVLLQPYDIQFAEGASGLKRMSADRAMKDIWRIAKIKLEEANTALNGQRRW